MCSNIHYFRIDRFAGSDEKVLFRLASGGSRLDRRMVAIIRLASPN